MTYTLIVMEGFNRSFEIDCNSLTALSEAIARLAKRGLTDVSLSIVNRKHRED